MKKTLKCPVKLSLKSKKSLKNWVFFLPLLFGIVFFFIIPVFKSFLFSISDVTSGPTGYQFEISGFKFYNEAFNVHTSYRQTVVSSAISMFTTTPLIIFFSFFMASVLNQNFKGKTFFRTVLFLPIVLTVMESRSNGLESSMSVFSDSKTTTDTLSSFTEQIADLMVQSGLSAEVAEKLTGFADGIYDVIGLSSIQILILLVAMQSVSPSLYEAAYVEGATSWESFWKITFPMVSPTIIVTVVYTVIDSFTAIDNQVMKLIDETAFLQLKFSLASAMGWVYFLIIAALLAVMSFILSRFTIRYE